MRTRHPRAIKRANCRYQAYQVSASTGFNANACRGLDVLISFKARLFQLKSEKIRTDESHSRPHHGKKRRSSSIRELERLEGRIMIFSGCDGHPKKNARR